jgi:CRP/FNR family transcriptional regulator, anaerobic regulatory protein
MPSRRFRFVAEPSIAAIPLREPSRGRRVSLLTPSDKAALMAIGSVVELPKGSLAYRAQAAADCVYNLVQGVVKTFVRLPDETTHVSGFHFPGDMFGLAEEGEYIDAAEAIVPSIVFKIPLGALEDLLSSHRGLAVRLVQRLAHALRVKHRHALLLSRRDAVGRIATFLLMLEGVGDTRRPGGTLYFPMTRSDAADYIGLTLEAVSRGFALLEQRGIVTFVDRHHCQILDRPRLVASSIGVKDALASRPRSTARKRAR